MRGFAGTACAVLVGALLSSCSGIGGSSPQGLTPTLAVRSSGARAAMARHGAQPAWNWQRGIFVTDFSNSVFAYRHCSGANSLICPAQTFSFNNGISGPAGAWVEYPNRLFIANGSNATVTRYGSNNPTAQFTYSAGLHYPQDVVTDQQNHVYVADYGQIQTGSIKEYKLNQNTIFKQCSTPAYLGPSGIAVDAHGDVFISWSDYVSSHISEYVGGLTGCNPTTVLSFNNWGVLGLTFDFAGNLLIADEGGQTVWTSPPPYTTKSPFVTGVAALDVRINRNNTQALVTDYTHVYLYSYPGGAFQQMLTTANGFSFVYAAVDWRNSSL